MIPIRLTLANFMCYRAASDTEAPTLCFEGLHVVCLCGENGAGKSALLDAITWALWGEARVADDDLISQGASEMFVDLEFCLGPQRYRVRRARQRGGVGKRGGQTPGKSQLDLFAQDGERWRPIGENGVRETQQQINALLHMSYQTFINASFLLQGRADEFTARTPAERKQVLADILDLGEYATLEARARERARALDDQLKGLQGRIGHLSQQAEQVPFWEEQVRAAEGHAAQVEARYARTRDEQSAAAERLRLLEARAERRKDVQRLLAERRADLARREQDLAGLRARIAGAEALLARREAIHAGMQALAAVRAEVERLDALRDRYEELSRRQADLRQQFAEEKARLRERLRAAQARQEDLARRAARRETLLAELGTLAATLGALAPLVAERARRAAEAESLARQVARIDDLLRRRASLAATLQARREALQTARDARRAELERLEAQLEQAERWRADLAAARADQTALVDAEERLVTLRAAERTVLERLSALRAAAQTAQNESKKLKRNRALLDEGAGVCPVCGSPLGAQGIAEARRHYDAELDRLREAEAVARHDARRAETELEATRSAIAELEMIMIGLRGSAARVESLERQLEAVPAWRAEADARRADLDELRARLDADAVDPPIQAELAAIAADLDLLGDPQELAQSRRMLDERLAELDRQLHTRGQLEGRQEAYREELRRIEADLGDLPALTAEVAELQRVIDTNDFAHALRDEGLAVRAAIEALGYDAEAHAAAREQARALRHWEEEERALAVAQEGLNRDRTILIQNEELRARDSAEVERLTREDALLEQELRELPRAQARLAELQQTLSATDRELQAARRDHAEKSSYLRQARDAAAELEQARSQERALQERYGLFAELAEAFGKKGVQAMLIETAIPQIEDEANRLLGRMTDNQMHVSFDMQRDTKKGDTVETLEIRIADALGTRVYDAFSGGEAMRANFAIRIALSRLLARRAGARLETLVIDEGFGVLDAPGRERMVEAITSVQEDFKRIIVITHIDELKDRFPAHIEVTKTPLGSRWEIR
jgi:exonuclease SbcC